LETGIPLEQVLEVSSVPQANIIKRLRAKAGLIKRQLELNTPIRYLLSSLYRNKLLYGYVTNLNDLGFDYIKMKLGGRVKLIDNHSLCPSYWPESISKNAEQQIHETTEKLIDKINQTAIKRDIKLTEQQKQYLYDITFKALADTKIYLNVMKSCMPKTKCINLLTGANGNHFSRMLSVIIRNNGGSVTSFQHGEPIIYNWDKYDWLELSCADNFFTYTKNLAIVLETLNTEYKPLRSNFVEINGAETNMFYDIWKKESKKPIPDKVERVMMVPRSFEPDNQVGAGISFSTPMQLDWELRIANTLKKAGFTVLYKRHPARRNQAVDYLEDAQTIYEPLEEVMDLTDAFVLYCTRTSTLGPILCTNKPVIYIDVGLEQMPVKMRIALEKRCHIINAHFDERNRLVFREDELIGPLLQKPTGPDMEFAQTYMFSQSSL